MIRKYKQNILELQWPYVTEFPPEGVVGVVGVVGALGLAGVPPPEGVAGVAPPEGVEGVVVVGALVGAPVAIEAPPERPRNACNNIQGGSLQAKRSSFTANPQLHQNGTMSASTSCSCDIRVQELLSLLDASRLFCSK